MIDDNGKTLDPAEVQVWCAAFGASIATSGLHNDAAMLRAAGAAESALVAFRHVRDRRYEYHGGAGWGSLAPSEAKPRKPKGPL
jgi:hypothetical protein